MRTIIFVAVAILLAGCETDEDFWRPVHDVMGEPGKPETAAGNVHAPDPVDAHCRVVAHQRALDARANGYSIELEDAIYQGTYKDCLAWDSEHHR